MGMCKSFGTDSEQEACKQPWPSHRLKSRCSQTLLLLTRIVNSTATSARQLLQSSAHSDL